MTDLALNIRKNLTGVSLIPAPVQVLGRDPQLDNEVAGQVLGVDLAQFLPPEPKEGGLVTANDDTGVGAADEVTAVKRSGNVHFSALHDRLNISNVI